MIPSDCTHRPAARSPRPRAFHLLPALVLILLTSACASWGSEDYRPSLAIEARLDKGEYRPGEAVLVDVTLTNQTNEPMQVRQLDASSVNLAYNRLGDQETPVLREPVYARNQPLGNMITLGPGESVSAQFVFTRLTTYRGAMKGIVQYDPNPPQSHINGPKVVSGTLVFAVEGQALIARDPAGLITPESAIELARQAYGRPVAETDALVVEDRSTGLYVTWVNLTPEGSTNRIGYVIDPYKGTVLAPARPFNRAAVPDPRFSPPQSVQPRPANVGGISLSDRPELNLAPPETTPSTAVAPAQGGSPAATGN